MGAESEIRDALTNLVLNAVDAMPQGGTLTLRTHVKETPVSPGEMVKAVVIEVSDTGMGMSDAVRNRCLEPFFTTKGERGTGLGLAMVYGMAQRHSAELEIDSAVGRGTTIRLTFQVSTITAVESMRAELQPAVPLRLLLVDDDPLLLQSLQDVLSLEGHEVTAADGGQRGIDEFYAARGRGEPFAVVVTDLGMPKVDGRTVAAAIKSASPETPVVLLTGWGQRLRDEAELPEYVDRVLSKPPRVSELRATLALLGGTVRKS
jgi:CheY-like chemotaxis protein